MAVIILLPAALFIFFLYPALHESYLRTFAIKKIHQIENIIETLEDPKQRIMNYNRLGLNNSRIIKVAQSNVNKRRLNHESERQNKGYVAEQEKPVTKRAERQDSTGGSKPTPREPRPTNNRSTTKPRNIPSKYFGSERKGDSNNQRVSNYFD